MGKKKLTTVKASVLYTVIMWALALVCVYPFIMMVLISFRNQGDIYLPLFSKVRITIDNYTHVLTTRFFGRWYWNTFRTVIVSIFFRLLVTIPASYAFSRMRFRGRALILGILVATMMVPTEATMVSRYLYFKQLHILNSSLANIPMQLAGASLSVVPIIVLFVFTQKFFVAGISSSGIKG